MQQPKERPNLLYRVWYGDVLMYVGRTHQPLPRRLHGHFFGKPMHRKLDASLVSRVEFAECGSEADMYLYEIYYICKLKPPANCDDRACDALSVELPELSWHEAELPLMDKWRSEIARRDDAFDAKKAAERETFAAMRKAGKHARKVAANDMDHPAWDDYVAARDAWEQAAKEAKAW